jgi:hypothetical protein
MRQTSSDTLGSSMSIAVGIAERTCAVAPGHTLTDLYQQPPGQAGMRHTGIGSAKRNSLRSRSGEVAYTHHIRLHGQVVTPAHAHAVWMAIRMVPERVLAS